MSQTPIAVTGTTHVTSKPGLSRWARAHAGTPGITWSVLAGDGGTMVIVEHAHDRAALREPLTGVCSDCGAVFFVAAGHACPRLSSSQNAKSAPRAVITRGAEEICPIA